MSPLKRRWLGNKALSLWLLLVTFGLTACGQADEEQEIVVRPVRIVVVNEDATAHLKTFSGVSRSAQESRLSFKVSGTIARVPAKVGDRIEAGAVIASLDASTYDLQLQQAQATVEQSRASSRNARAAYQRTRALYANNNTSLGDLDASRANSDSVAAQLRAARKSLQLAELNLSYTKLTVDVDCVVDSISVSVNENVSTNTEVARVNCSDELEIEIAVPESVIGDLDNGKVAKIKFDTIAGIDFSGKVIEVGVGASGLGSTFPVTILVDGNNSSDIRPGLAASVSFTNDVDSKRDYLLPLSAVVQGPEGAFVYVVNPLSANELESEGTVSKKAISLGALQTGGIEVSAGLSTGDRVVVAGVSFVREGLMVSF
ncbi:MAG: RND family efflux transporter MFP subunit [Arenicella sp.]|jgi:RND family efflux transporter MFP subunit